MEQIDRDVMRTHPDMHFFSGESPEAEEHRREMKRALFMYAKLNPGLRYIQVRVIGELLPADVGIYFLVFEKLTKSNRCRRVLELQFKHPLQNSHCEGVDMPNMQVQYLPLAKRYWPYVGKGAL
jgi:hypothetical protein